MGPCAGLDVLAGDKYFAPTVVRTRTF